MKWWLRPWVRWVLGGSGLLQLTILGAEILEWVARLEPFGSRRWRLILANLDVFAELVIPLAGCIVIAAAIILLTRLAEREAVNVQIAAF